MAAGYAVATGHRTPGREGYRKDAASRAHYAMLHAAKAVAVCARRGNNEPRRSQTNVGPLAYPSGEIERS